MPEPLPFEPRRVLAIGAHPDDVEFFAGGTLARLIGAGAAAALVVCTDGGRGGRDLADPAGMRRDEQAHAAAALGLGTWEWLAHADGALGSGDPLRAELVHAVRRLRPELVLAHDPRTLWTRIGAIDQPGHSDHRAAGQAALDAVYPRAPSPNFHGEQLAPAAGDAGVKPWYPREVWLFDTSQPDLRVDVTAVFETKLAALRAHASQEAVAGGLVEAARAIGAHWGAPGRPAEAFVRLRLY
jgi:LmbE family N-acetylglucosaminyl deacetylase